MRMSPRRPWSPLQVPVSARRAAIARRLIGLALTAAVVVGLAPPAFAGAPTCAATPLTGCRASQTPEQTRLWLNNRSGDRRDTVVWKWRRGAASSTADFGDPVNNHGYAVCLYSGSGALLFHATVPSGGSCGQRSCWRPVGNAYHYRNGHATPDGLTKIQLRPGGAGHAGVIVKGRGAHLGLPAMPITPPLTIQLQEESGPCWASTFAADGIRMNDATRFRAAASH